jgi:hypothetical protein
MVWPVYETRKGMEWHGQGQGMGMGAAQRVTS